MQIHARYIMNEEEDFLSVQIYRGEILIYEESIDVEGMNEKEIKAAGEQAVCKFMSVVNAVPASAIMQGFTKVVPIVKKIYADITNLDKLKISN